MARMGTAALAGTGLALLGIGVGIGTWLAGGAPAELPETRTPEARPAAPAREAGTSPARPAAEPPAAPAATSAPTPAALDAVRNAMATLPAVAVPSGTGVIRGRVQREDGQPLPGVEVTLQPEPPRGAFPTWIPGRDPEPDLESQIATLIARTRWYREAKKVATTDVVGEFRFEGLFDTGHSITPRLKGWQIFSRSNDAYRARPGADVSFRAQPVVEVPVEIALPDGTAPPQAQVRVSMGTGGMSGYGWTPENPTIQVKPGTYQVSAITGDWNREDLKSDEQTVVFSTDAPPPTLRFTLRGRPGIKGRVFLEGFSSDGGFQVRCARIPADAKPDPALLQVSAALNTWANPHDGFAFGFPDLAPGRYLIGVSMPQRQKAAAWETVEVAGDAVTKDLRISSLDPEEFLVIRTVGPDGGSVAVQQFQTGFQSGNNSSSTGGQPLRRNDGAYLVVLQDTGSTKVADDAVWWVEAVSQTLGTKRVEFRRGQTQEVVLRFEEPGVVEVTLAGYRGSPLEGVLQISLQPAEAPGGDSRVRRPRFGGPQARVDSEGRATIAGVQPGECEVVTYANNNPMRAYSRTALTVRSGRNAASVPVPAVHSVTVLGVDGNAFLNKTGDPYWGDSRQADGEGRVVYDLLPEGDYSVRSGQKKQDFHLPGTTEVRL